MCAGGGAHLIVLGRLWSNFEELFKSCTPAVNGYDGRSVLQDVWATIPVNWKA